MTQGMKDAKGNLFHGRLYIQLKCLARRESWKPTCWRYRPTIADGEISIKGLPAVHGDREDPARLVFTSKTGHGIATSLVDLGTRFRLIINDVECKKQKSQCLSFLWQPRSGRRSQTWQPGQKAGFWQAAPPIRRSPYDLTAEQMGRLG